MVGPAAVFSGVTTDAGRLLVTIGLLVLLVVGGLLAREVRRRLDVSGPLARLVNVVLVGAVLALAVAVGASLVTVWEGTIVVTTVLSAFNVDDPLALATRLVVSLVILVGAYLVSGLLRRFIHEFTRDRTAITQHQTELVFRSTQLGVYVLAAIVVLGVWQVDLGGLLVGAGFLGIVVGLAARQTLGSLIAGFVLMFARPFEIGDWVQIGDREGIVTEISIVNTRIQTFDGEYAMLPNDTVGASEVINRTRKGRLRVQVDVGVDYETDLERAIDVAEEAMRDVDEVLAVPQPRAVLVSFDDSAILLNLRFWIDKPSSRRRWRAQTAVVAAVKSAFDEAGIKIPYPQRELSNRPESGASHLEGEPPVVRGEGDRRVEEVPAASATEDGDGASTESDDEDTSGDG